MKEAGGLKPRADDATVAAAGMLATVVAITSHEVAHLLAAHLAGGVPELLSSTDMRGNWSLVRPRGFLLIGAAGSVANYALAALAWLVFRRDVGAPGKRALVAWAFFVINLWMPTLYLVVSPALGFGDWMTALDSFANAGPMRASAVACGLFLAGLAKRWTEVTAAQLVGQGRAADRSILAGRIGLVVVEAGAAVAVAAALLSPLDPLWAIGVAFGSTIGATWPVPVIVRKVGEQPVPGSPLVAERSWALIVTAVALSGAFITVLGPGIEF